MEGVETGTWPHHGGTMNEFHPTLRTLLDGTIDYAGLFPPAGLPIGTVAGNSWSYRNSPGAWLLGRCVVPAQRLVEFHAAIRAIETERVGPPLAVSALTGPDPDADAARIRHFLGLQPSSSLDGIAITAIETRAGSPRDVGRLLKLLPTGVPVFVEIPLAPEPDPFLECIAAEGAGVKARTGGTTHDAFPRPEMLARFIHRTITAGIPFKCTAGLHHPLRGNYRLTYEQGSPEGTMFGFLNVLLGAAFALIGMPEAELVALLCERSASAFRFTDQTIVWNGHTIAADDLRRFRRRFGASFGSCSFTEPLQELHALGLL